MSEVAALELEAVIGFGGKVPGGLQWHPDGQHIIYPLGTAVVIKSLEDGRQSFLTGHDNDVTCVAVSKCGRYIASGQMAPMGKKCPIILWDFEAGLSKMDNHSSSETCIIHNLLFHKVSIQSLNFSEDGEFLASLGGQDDNSLCIWETSTGRPVVGTPAASHASLAVAFLHGRNDKLVTAGQYHVRFWDFHYDRRRLYPEDFKTGGLKRIFTTVAISDDNNYVYAGTSTGDVVQFCTDGLRFVQTSSHRFAQGVTSLVPVQDYLFVGTGDGAVVKLGINDLKFRQAAELMGGVTSIAPAQDEQTAFCGTTSGNIYGIDLNTLASQLRGTAHSHPITDICFPFGTSDLFLTASGCDVRIWHTQKRQELLRIQVPNLSVLCVAINDAGNCIATGWSDGKIRAFAPESGKLLWTITDAHAEAVTAIAFTHAGNRLISGGRDGRVRVWLLSSRSQSLELSWKEHKKEVTSVSVSANDEELISSSADGSCLVWSLRRGTRSNALFASTIFREIRYHPDESQLVTVGSDRKITYWDTVDCTAIRVINGSTEEIMSIDVEPAGETFVTGGLDRIVKVWLYDEGDCIASGAGHAGQINKIKVSPDRERIISVGSEGAIFIWSMPVLQ